MRSLVERTRAKKSRDSVHFNPAIQYVIIYRSDRLTPFGVSFALMRYSHLFQPHLRDWRRKVLILPNSQVVANRVKTCPFEWLAPTDLRPAHLRAMHQPCVSMAHLRGWCKYVLRQNASTFNRGKTWYQEH
jgi:hypothetical protein